MVRAWLPPLLLALYALAFAWRALGGGVLAGDDHPGQLYRLAQVGQLGPWPWRLNPGWWAGYAELQYYPPGFAYAGALLEALSVGALGPDRAYQLLLWLTFLLPGATTYALLRRVLGDPWLALPGAFLAATLSGDCRSGVEEGLRWGLVSSRLAWGLVPLLGLALWRWTARGSSPIAAAPVLAAIVLTHPAHAPAGLALVGLAASEAPGPRARRLGQASVVVALGLGLAAFWLLPFAAHIRMALPLAWGPRSPSALAAQIASRPLLLGLAAAAAAGLITCLRTRAPALWLALAPAMAALVVLDAIVVEPLGVAWLPADRLVDTLLLALIIGASIALAELTRRRSIPTMAAALAAIAACLALAEPGRPEPTLTLWPSARPTDWPDAQAVVAGARLDALWSALARAPAGRVLFVRSSVPLAGPPEWGRPHSHATALTPLRAGREIVNGTFTHPAPLAGLVAIGSAANRPITTLVERRDGVTLFGRPLAELGAGEFEALAARLRLSAVVALVEDAAHVGFVEADPAFAGPSRIGPFLVFFARAPRPMPERRGLQEWVVPTDDAHAPWVATGLAYSPLWRASAGGRPLAVRRDDLGLLDVEAPPGPAAQIHLVHAAGPAEWAGLAVSAASVLALAALVRRGGRS